jgi:ATP-dependent exoDNAse (exonuclease V) alpha subunit
MALVRPPQPTAKKRVDDETAAAMNGFAPWLNPEQAAAKARLDSGQNVFLTGVAGTGKTRTLNAWLHGRDPVEYAVTASTGIAATHLNGQTVHRWSGCGIGDKTAEQIAASYWWREKVMGHIAAAKALVIDEVSMLDGIMFELIERLCALARGSSAPFGGIQVVLVGDMGQLAPVEGETKGFPFETDAWHNAGIETVELKRVMRQQDESFARVLWSVRDGSLSPEGYELLARRVRAYDPEQVGAVRLMTHNNRVDEVNAKHLDAIPGESVLLKAYERGEGESVEWMEKNCLAPRELRLKVGARVMAVKNSPGGGFVNGHLGWVVAIEPEGLDPAVTVKFDHEDNPRRVLRETWERKQVVTEHGRTFEKTLALRVQFPLRLAWAITVHKSQGMTLDKVSVDLRSCFAPGQAYVALSRARTLEGLNIEEWKGPASIIVHETVAKFIRGEYVLPTGQAAAAPDHDYPLY